MSTAACVLARFYVACVPLTHELLDQETKPIQQDDWLEVGAISALDWHIRNDYAQLDKQRNYRWSERNPSSKRQSLNFRLQGYYLTDQGQMLLQQVALKGASQAMRLEFTSNPSENSAQSSEAAPALAAVPILWLQGQFGVSSFEQRHSYSGGAQFSMVLDNLGEVLYG